MGLSPTVFSPPAVKTALTQSAALCFFSISFFCFFLFFFFMRLMPRTFLPVRSLRTRHMSNVRLGRTIKNSLRGTPTVRDKSRTALTQSAAVGSTRDPPASYARRVVRRRNVDLTRIERCVWKPTSHEDNDEAETYNPRSE